jgi:SMI1 / KNR4 family (SUKH-1)
MNIGDIWPNFEINPPADPAAIAAAEHGLGHSLPGEYMEFLRVTNGAEGPIGTQGYLQLWRVEELVPLNEAYEVATFAPGLLLFGSDGGGSGYGFDTETTGGVVEVPFVGMNRTEIRPIADTFNEYLKHLAAL